MSEIELPAATPAVDHEVVWTIDGGRIRGEAVCNLPPGSNCRLTCAEGCESYNYERDERGRPFHRLGVLDEDGAEWHPLVPMTDDECNVALFLNESDQDIDELCDTSGPEIARTPIKPIWNGDHYTYEVTEPVTGAAPEPDLVDVGEALKVALRAGAVVHVHHHDIERHAEWFNEGYETAVTQGLADDPTKAEEWLERHDAELLATHLTEIAERYRNNASGTRQELSGDRAERADLWEWFAGMLEHEASSIRQEAGLDSEPCASCGGTGQVRQYLGYKAGGGQYGPCPTCVMGIPEAD